MAFSLFQSTHPRRVRLSTRSRIASYWYISIHTPAKGATFRFYYLSNNNINFNPHTREGCDSISRSFSMYPWISIHTPAKGATFFCFNFRVVILFQSTHPRRVRPPARVIRSSSKLFQSTHPRRVRRLRACVHVLSAFYFNPHTREGCDVKNTNLYTSQKDFNPHTREGCDTCMESKPTRISISIHTPAKGATIKLLLLLLTKIISIHTPAKGATITQKLHN